MEKPPSPLTLIIHNITVARTYISHRAIRAQSDEAQQQIESICVKRVSGALGISTKRKNAFLTQNAISFL